MLDNKLTLEISKSATISKKNHKKQKSDADPLKKKNAKKCKKSPQKVIGQNFCTQQ